MSRKLRIAVWYYLPSGGAKRALFNHLTGLLQSGHHIEIWRPPVEQTEFLDLSKLAKETEIPRVYQDSNHPFYPLRVLQILGQAQRWVDSMDLHSQKCAKEIQQGNFDILFANTCMMFHAPMVGRYILGKKLLYLQEPNRPLYEPLPRLPWLLPPKDEVSGLSLKSIKARVRYHLQSQQARFFAREELISAKTYDQILVNSAFSRESVLKAYGLNSRVCYLGIDPGLFQFQNLPRQNFVMGLGTMGPSKNVKLAIQGVATVPVNIRPKLVWVANMTDEVYLREMEQLARDLSVDFELKYMIPDHDLVTLLNQAKAMVYAPRLEPFGFAPLEANACGTPVVGVAEGGVRETVENGVNGLLVDHDPEAVGEALQRLLCDEALWQSMSQAGRQLVSEKWSLRAGNQRLEKALLEVA